MPITLTHEGDIAVTNGTITIDGSPIGGGGGGTTDTVDTPSFILINSGTPTTLSSISGLELDAWYMIAAGCYIDPDYGDGLQKSRIRFVDGSDNALPYPKGFAAAYNTSYGVLAPDGASTHNYIGGSSYAVVSGSGFTFEYDADSAGAWPFFYWLYKPTTAAQQTIKFTASRSTGSGSFYISEIVLSATKLATA